MRRSWLRLFLAGVLVLGLVSGYLVWSGTAGRLLHREVESALSRRLGRAVEIASVGLRLERGLRVSIHNLRIHPTPTAEGVPLLRAGRVVAWIDIPTLLIGRLALSGVVLEGPSLRIERAADGSFPALGLPALDAGRRVEREDVYGEGLVRAIESLEPLAQGAALRLRFASRLELRDGTVTFVDRMRAGEPAELRLELLQIEAERNWLSEAGSLELEAVVVDGRTSPFPISFAVRRDEDQPFVWDLTWQGVSLSAARRLVPSLPLLAGLKGRWSANLHADRNPAGEIRLVLESTVEKASLVLPRSGRRMAWDALDFQARIELARDEVRLREGKLGGNRIRSDFEATVERPLRPASGARLETRLLGVELGDVRTIVDSLESEFVTARSMARLIERVESGRIRHIEASGSAPLVRWQSLWRGPERELPADLLLAGAFDQVDIAGEPAEAIRDLEGEVDWVGDKLVLRNARGRYRGAWLPQMNLSIDGVSELVRATRNAKRITATPPPIPGLSPLAQILRPRDPNALPPIKAIGLAIDRLEHPLLFFPLVDARVLVEPVRRGVQINVREGRVGSANVAGEVVWSSEPGDGKVAADLHFTRFSSESDEVSASASSSTAPDGTRPNRATASQAELTA